MNLDKELFDPKAGMTPIVKTIARFAIGIVVIFGAYIVLYGHLTPGGGFAGGVILASGYVLLMLSFGRELSLRKLGDTAASVLDNAGALAFLSIGLLGYTGGFFFQNLFPQIGERFRLVSAGSIPLSNIAIGVKVTSSVFAVFVALSIFGRFVSTLVDEEEAGRE